MAKASVTPKSSTQMKPAWERYDAGDIVTARKLAREVAQAPQTPLDASEANDLLNRTRIPPRALAIAAGALAVLIFLWLLAAHRGALTA